MVLDLCISEMKKVNNTEVKYVCKIFTLNKDNKIKPAVVLHLIGAEYARSFGFESVLEMIIESETEVPAFIKAMSDFGKVYFREENEIL